MIHSQFPKRVTRMPSVVARPLGRRDGPRRHNVTTNMMIRHTPALLRRFVPPWERAGMQVDDFFSGVLRARNPMEAIRKDVQRQQDAQDEEDRDAAQAYTAAEKAAARAAGNQRASAGADAEVEEMPFLPYGAQPAVYPKGGMAAWGTYQSNIQRPTDSSVAQATASASTTSSSPSDAELLLKGDYDTKLPYKFTESPPRPSSSSSSQSSSSSSSPKNNQQQQLWPYHGTAGFVLDIDGVIYRAGALIDGSDAAVRNMIDCKIPFVFCTNGGGKPEAQRAEELSRLVGAKIHPEQVVLSHSPMQHLVSKHGDEPVLILGAHPHAVEAARSYGFKYAMSVSDFQRQRPELVPLKRWPSGDYKAKSSDDSKNRITSEETQREEIRIVQEQLAEHAEILKDFTAEQEQAQQAQTQILPGQAAQRLAARYPEFGAVIMMNDFGTDLLNDFQVVLDVLTAPYGRVGQFSVSGEQTVPLYMAADDLIWPAKPPLPRLGQGVIREMFAAGFEAVTGTPLHVIQYGKPRRATYSFAAQQLRNEAKRLGWVDEPTQSACADAGILRTICMVGDNLETDIIGANAMGNPWLSVHVLSGVGRAPAAMRTHHPSDREAAWLREHVPSTPHYVAPTLDHFLREMSHFGEAAVTMNRPTGWYPPPCPVDLEGTYAFPRQ